MNQQEGKIYERIVLCTDDILLFHFRNPSKLLHYPPFFLIPQRTNHGLRRPNTHNYCVERGYVTYLSSTIIQTKPGLCFVGTDASQGKGQIISNINACVAVQSTIKSTLGPYGGDLLLVDSNGKQTITNDGATVMKVLLSLS